LITLLVGLTGLPAASARPVEVMVLRGDRSATVDVVLRRTTTFEAGGFEPARSMSARVGGTFAGFVIQRMDGSIAFGGVVVAGFTVDREPVPMVFGEGFESVRLPAGRYRVMLLANGRTEVRVPARGLGRAVILAPRRRADVRGELVRQTLPAGAPVSQVRVPMTVGRASTVMLATTQSYAAGAASVDDVCLARPGTTCATGSVSGGTGVIIGGGTGRLGTVQALFFYPGQTPALSYDAVFASTGAGVAERLAAFALRIG